VRVIDIITAPWAIQPEVLTEIQDIYIAHTRGPKLTETDIKAIEARIGKPLDNKEMPYDVSPGGTATIYVDGILAKRMNAFQRISGGVSTQLLARDFNDAMANASVRAILLYVDSPGGAVDGIQDLAQVIFNSRGQGKPIIAFTDGGMLSAAYWVAAAADRIYISNNTTSVGSIGIVARHVDVSKAEEMRGIKTTEITAGRYKRIASEYASLSESGRNYIQDTLDYLYSVFVNDVARYRGLSAEPIKVGKTETIPWADGMVFRGVQAINAGLVDGVSTLPALISNIEKNPASFLDRASVADETERRLRNNGNDS
jgi:signal peptide peptidase SppA